MDHLAAARIELADIERSAKKKAVDALKSRFQELNDLSQPGQDIDAYKIETKSKLATVSVLVDASYAKHDSRAALIIQRVRDSYAGVTGIRDGMSELQQAVHSSSFWAKDERLASARGLIRDAQNAKQNVTKTLDLCHQWLGVPTRVKQLKASLDSEPLMLLSVYQELNDLEEWRRSLTFLLGKLGRMLRKQSVVGLTSQGGVGDITMENYNDILNGFSAHMESVYELDEAVKSALTTNVKRCFELGTTNPALLVMTFLVRERGGAAQCHRALPAPPPFHLCLSL
jgi:hypothetical protein